MTDHSRWSTFSECVIVIVIVGRGLELSAFPPRRVAECWCQQRRQLYPVNQVSSCRGRVIVQFVCDASLFCLCFEGKHREAWSSAREFFGS